MTTFEFAERLADRFGFDRSLLVPVTTAKVHPGAPRPLRAGLLTLRAQSELGFRATPLDEALDALGRRLGLLD